MPALSPRRTAISGALKARKTDINATMNLEITTYDYKDCYAYDTGTTLVLKPSYEQSNIVLTGSFILSRDLLLAE